ncbi:Thioredoxin reductase family protein [Roseomonas mucosa]|uniref:Thioredoxin reductase n=1 Tax=Roseomonas mucosa TaxID=207340 RepID=A0A1S8D888_9PROT|nr:MULTISPECIES: NAD(P)/FAD-dependent oxidoreductase [Roseomonas]MBS5901745.1 NAD(P)/FAD-dependent oxidoreductase [Acetobacteraceae bacterium]MCG7350450.1 NAD(P)/FAD-dependent oxidoreductase [Roseomonas mucosa]MCG7355751.1 NAD(P)/FAD-dependent oxidoreductase [Roseomonas mucosa]MDT8289318.1 NAD(P)/FAD-dependent oxidoreductase [Roseomonas mucosa]MDT8292438.1 NAD(P)/FAD-dependent oxidoreductase [Roseomonas mucosa]
MADPRRVETEAGWEVVVVGAGPAGLSAALILGRCDRRTLVCDSGQHRNAAAKAMRGYLGRDGTPPSEMLRIAQQEIARYPSVSVQQVTATKAVRQDDGAFRLELSDGRVVVAPKLILATGVVDQLPPLEGLDAVWGRSAWRCPICDGWEHRGRPLAVHGNSEDAVRFALEIRHWTPDLVLCTDGPPEYPDRWGKRLEGQGIAIRTDRIARLESEAGNLSAILFAQGDRLPREGLFLATPWRQRCDLAEALGCEMTEHDTARTGRHEASTVPGLYLAGDIAGGYQLAIVAAAQGATAAVAVNTELIRDGLRD